MEDRSEDVERELADAVARNSTLVTRLILEKYPRLRTAYQGKSPLLHIAAMNGSYEVAAQLLGERSERQFALATDADGYTALHWAVIPKKEVVCESDVSKAQIVDLLLKMAPECAATKANDGTTPLHLAARYNNKTAVCKILDICPDAAYQVDGQGRMPAEGAFSNATIKSLVLGTTTHGSKTSHQDLVGRGPTPRVK